MKKQFLFPLPYDVSRKVYKDPSTDILSVKSPYTSETYREKYSVFVKAYEKKTFLHQVRDLYHLMQAGLYTKKKNFFQLVLSFLWTPVPRIYRYGNFLDVGCNTGSFLSKLPDPWKRYGIEISKNAYRASKQYKNITVFEGSLESMKTKVKFDFVRISHVIEHISEYDAFFAKLSQLTEKNGYVLFYTPNTDSISYRLFKENWGGFYEQTHVMLFNLDNLKEVASRHGFIVVQEGTYYMGVTVDSLLRKLGLVNGRPFFMVLFYGLLLLLYPFSFLVNYFQKGGALYLYLKKVDNVKVAR